jgi:hypothetical protein
MVGWLGIERPRINFSSLEHEEEEKFQECRVGPPQPSFYRLAWVPRFLATLTTPWISLRFAHCPSLFRQ